MKILVVDDDEFAVAMLENMLQKDGHLVVTASDGVEAMEVLEKGDVRLVVTDWMMRGMSGVELCRRIRDAGFISYIYVILLTARSDSQDVIDGLSAGADDFLRKPCNPAELTMRILAAQRILGQETRDLAIFSLAKLAESRDSETGAHLERMRRYAHILASHLSRTPHAERLGINGEFVRLVYATSPLHDIGKVGIPDAILRKPGKLTAEEFEIMKTHTTIGAETLAAALHEYPEAAFLRFAHDIALTHHERVDGTGYPRGLRGDEIPICGRVVALADVYDALTSQRVYKPAMDHETAASFIVEQSGLHFDPLVVRAFLACQEQFQLIASQMQDAVACMAS